MTLKTKKEKRGHCILFKSLLAGALVHSGSSLVTGSIQVRAKFAPSRPLDGDASCNTERTAIADGSETDNPDNQFRRRRNTKSKIINYESIEEKERRELNWIVRNTSKIVGPDSQPPGQMTPESIKLTFDLMRAWARRSLKKESKAPHVVERLLQRLLKEKDAGNQHVRIDATMYNILLDAWSCTDEKGSAERSEEILLKMEQKSNEGDETVRPDEDSYNAVIKAYVKNGDRSIAATKAEELLNRMEALEQVSPTRRSYNLVLYALSNSPLKDAAYRADAILRKMLNQYHESGDNDAKPDINSFNQVLAAYARGRGKESEASMQAIYQEILDQPLEMNIQPDADTFNAYMGGLLKSKNPETLQKMEDTLKEMKQSFDSGNLSAKPDRITINTILAAYSKTKRKDAINKTISLCALMEEKYQVQPDTVSQNIIIDSWCKSGRADAPERVSELLSSMERDFKRGNIDQKPDGYTYSSVIGCYVRFGRANAAQKSEELLRRMQDLYHNFGGDPVSTSVYNARINAWVSSDKKQALRKVKELLKTMEENDGKDPLIPKPNLITYNTILKAMQQDGDTRDAEYAESLLKTLEERGQNQPSLMPDAYSYASVISAYGRSDTPEKAEKAFELLNRMLSGSRTIKRSSKRTLPAFNAALNACAFVSGSDEEKKNAFKVARKIFELLEQNSKPDHISYGTLLRACSTLLKPKDEMREEMVEELFSKACQTGNVGGLVVAQMKFSSNPDQHFRLTGIDIDDRVNMKELPRAWTRNVRERRGFFNR